jgi:hypothetical protein
MPADRFIAADGSVRWHIYGDGLEAIITDAMYQNVQRHADEIQETARRKELGHPLFNSELGMWNGVTRLRSSPPPRIRWIGIDWASEPDRTATMLVLPKPWLLPDGRPPGGRHIILPAPHPRRVLTISIGQARYHATTPEGYRL